MAVVVVAMLTTTTTPCDAMRCKRTNLIGVDMDVDGWMYLHPSIHIMMSTSTPTAGEIAEIDRWLNALDACISSRIRITAANVYVTWQFAQSPILLIGWNSLRKFTIERLLTARIEFQVDYNNSSGIDLVVVGGKVSYVNHKQLTDEDDNVKNKKTNNGRLPLVWPVLSRVK